MAINLIKFKNFAKYAKDSEGHLQPVQSNDEAGEFYLVGYKVNEDEKCPEVRIPVTDLGGAGDTDFDVKNLSIVISEDNKIQLSYGEEKISETDPIRIPEGDGIDWDKFHFGFSASTNASESAFYIGYGESEVLSEMDELYKVPFYVHVTQDNHLVFDIGETERAFDLPLPTSGGGGGGEPGGPVQEATIFTLNEVTVNTTSYAPGTTPTPKSTGEFTLVEGEDNTYNLELNLQVEKGDPGKGIDTISSTTVTGGKQYTVTYTDGTTYIFVVNDGKDGTSLHLKKTQQECLEVGDGYIINDETSEHDGWLSVLQDDDPRTFEDISLMRIVGPQGDPGMAYFYTNKPNENELQVKFYTEADKVNTDYTAVRFKTNDQGAHNYVTIETQKYIDNVAQPLNTVSLDVKDGEPGKSAFAIAQEHDQTLQTETQWLESLRGETPTISSNAIRGTNIGGRVVTFSTQTPQQTESVEFKLQSYPDEPKRHTLSINDYGVDIHDGDDGTNFELYRIILFGNEISHIQYVPKTWENPAKMGLLTSQYVPTTDTTPDNSKTYYTYGAINTSHYNVNYGEGIYSNDNSRSLIYKYNVATKQFELMTHMISGGVYVPYLNGVTQLNGIIQDYATNNNGGYMVDVCPDTEYVPFITKAMQYGFYGRYHRTGEGNEGQIRDNQETLNLLFCKPIAEDDEFHTFGFTVKVYKNIK